MDVKLQAQVRSLTRDVGALREELRQEQKKRERVAAHAKACEEARAADEAKVKQLTYVNTKLEQELRTVKDRAQAGAAKSRSGLDTLKGRLADVERSVHHRSVEAVQHVQRLHSLVQELQAAAMPLAISAAAAAAKGPAAPGGGGPQAAAAAAPALKSPRQGSKTTTPRSVPPEQLHRQFAQVFGGLSQLSALFSGDCSTASDGTAAGNPPPLLLTAPSGQARTVHWQDQNSSANSAGSGPAGPRPPAPPPPSHTMVEQENKRLAGEVQQLRAALGQARQQAAAAAAAARSSASQPPAIGRVEAAMRQLDAVVPQYRAVAQALQGQVSVLKEKLAVAGRERAALQEEMNKWRGIAQKHEAAFAEAAAKLHAREAQSLAASTQAQTQTERLQSDADGLRRRCAELAGRLQEAQRALAQMQGSLAAKDQLVATQQQTIRQLEATIREQQADIRSALNLVSTRPAGLGAAGAGGLDEEPQLLQDGGSLDAGYGGDGGYYCGVGVGSTYGDGGGSWEASLPLGSVDEGPDDGSGAWSLGATPLASTGSGINSLLHAANAAADAAVAWVGGYEEVPAGVRTAGWGAEEDPAAHAAGGDGLGGWSGVGDEWGSCHSPHHMPLGGAHGQGLAAAGGGYHSPQRQPGRAQHAAAPQRPRSGSGLAAGLDCVESDIAGLEDALRTALSDLHV